VRKRFTLATVLCLALSVALAAAKSALARADLQEQDRAPAKSSDQKPSAKQAQTGGAARKKAALRAATAKKKADRSRTSTKKPDRGTELAMEPGIVCKSIDGYQDYQRLPGAAQTSDEKLLVYIRADGFQIEKVDKGVEGHLTADGEVRKRGEKAVVRQKKKMLDYKPKATTYPQLVYLKAAISLKGLAPGDYDLTIILHDEIAKGSSASQVIKFKVIPPKDPRNEKEPRPPPGELDSLYAPFLDFPGPDDDD
jgi:hypothetical protein